MLKEREEIKAATVAASELRRGELPALVAAEEARAAAEAARMAKVAMAAATVAKRNAERCPGMAFIAGTGPDGFVQDKNARVTMYVPDVCLDLTEVTVAAYQQCVDSGNCTRSMSSVIAGCNWGEADRQSHPVNCVTYAQASAYCTSVGKRLPGHSEWQWAARGREEGREYPWGSDAPNCTRAVMRDSTGACGADGTRPVGSLPQGNSRDGLQDMSGNVREWTSTLANSVDLFTPAGSFRDTAADRFRVTSQATQDPSRFRATVGFRCARSLAAP